MMKLVGSIDSIFIKTVTGTTRKQIIWKNVSSLQFKCDKKKTVNVYVNDLTLTHFQQNVPKLQIQWLDINWIKASFFALRHL
jgi:hypothetical protein